MEHRRGRSSRRWCAFWRGGSGWDAKAGACIIGLPTRSPTGPGPRPSRGRQAGQAGPRGGGGDWRCSMAKSVRGEILHLEREQVRAINRGDVRSALKLFDRGFVGFSSTKHQRIHGLGALRKTFEYYLKRAPKLAYHIEQPHVSVSGGTAVATFYWSVQLGWGRSARTTGKQKA